MKAMPNNMTQRGFSLVEVLVTLVVLAVGILGLVGLQITSMKNANNTYYRHQATILAQDMADRIMANPEATYSVAAGDLSGSTCHTGGNACSSASAMADSDAIEWKGLIEESALPGGDGTVDIVDTVYEITVSWNNLTREAQNDANISLTGDATGSITIRMDPL